MVASAQKPPWILKRAKVWLGIYNANPEHIVTRDDFHVITQKAGYSMKGLGGFFKGGSLVYISGNRISLSDFAISQLETYGFIDAEEEEDGD